VQANWLRSKGVGKGDSVAIYMPMLCELPIAMLACARIGAVHSVIFGGFSAEALAGRLEDSQPKALITCTGVKRAAKPIDLKAIADAGLRLSEERGHKVSSRAALVRRRPLGGRQLLVAAAVGRASQLLRTVPPTPAAEPPAPTPTPTDPRTHPPTYPPTAGAQRAGV
jgi:acyl-coenzyme A synthetase/AMP-(fatty) acid ligase